MHSSSYFRENRVHELSPTSGWNVVLFIVHQTGFKSWCSLFFCLIVNDSPKANGIFTNLTVKTFQFKRVQHECARTRKKVRIILSQEVWVFAAYLNHYRENYIKIVLTSFVWRHAFSADLCRLHLWLNDTALDLNSEKKPHLSAVSKYMPRIDNGHTE